MEPVAVRGVCDEVTEELKYLFRFQQRSLKVSYRNKQKLAVANRDLLHSIIYNFCVNALKYSDEDQTSLLTLKDKKQFIRLEVRDFGPAPRPRRSAKVRLFAHIRHRMNATIHFRT